MKSHELACAQGMLSYILDYPTHMEWTTQGFGMVRCYPAGDDSIRLNIWDSQFREPNVSIIHNHPWNLDSIVLSGRLINTRYLRADSAHGGRPYQCVKLKPGVAVLLSDIYTDYLKRGNSEDYGPGDEYYQRADEIHETEYIDGTVTINYRSARGPDIADVYWQSGPWVSAKPRPATVKEMYSAIAKVDGALRKRP